MSLCQEGVVFETGPDDLERDDQELDGEVDKMLAVWTRDGLMRDVEQERIREQNQKTKDDHYDGETDFDEILQKMDDVCDGQVHMKMIETNPQGKQINVSDTVLFDRIGYLEYMQMPIDNSLVDGKPSKINLSDGPIIPGLLMALSKMREGEKAYVMLAPSMAFGPLGCMPHIPENSFVYYYLHVHKVFEESTFKSILDYEQTYDTEAPREMKLDAIEEHNRVANTYMRDKNYRDALIRYKAAIKYIDEGFEPSMKPILKKLLQNAAIAYNHLKMYKSATRMSKRVLLEDPTNLKSLYNLAVSRMSLGDYLGALRYVDMAKKYDADNKIFDQLRMKINSKCEDDKRKRDEIFKKMSKGITTNNQ